MTNPSQEPPAPTKAPNQDTDFCCTLKINIESQILNICVSNTSHHIQIQIKMPNPCQEPLAPTKAPNKDSMEMDVLCTFKYKIESQNSEYKCIKDQLPYLNQDQDAKPKSRTSSPNQSLKSTLKGHRCSLHLPKKDRETKFRTWKFIINWPWHKYGVKPWLWCWPFYLTMNITLIKPIMIKLDMIKTLQRVRPCQDMIQTHGTNCPDIIQTSVSLSRQSKGRVHTSSSHCLCIRVTEIPKVRISPWVLDMLGGWSQQTQGVFFWSCRICLDSCPGFWVSSASIYNASIFTKLLLIFFFDLRELETF